MAHSWLFSGLHSLTSEYKCVTLWSGPQCLLWKFLLLRRRGQGWHRDLKSWPKKKKKKAGKVLQGPTGDELIGGVTGDLSTKKKSVLKCNKKEKLVWLFKKNGLILSIVATISAVFSLNTFFCQTKKRNDFTIAISDAKFRVRDIFKDVRPQIGKSENCHWGQRKTVKILCLFRLQ